MGNQLWVVSFTNILILLSHSVTPLCRIFCYSSWSYTLQQLLFLGSHGFAPQSLSLIGQHSRSPFLLALLPYYQLWWSPWPVWWLPLWTSSTPSLNSTLPQCHHHCQFLVQICPCHPWVMFWMWQLDTLFASQCFHQMSLLWPLLSWIFLVMNRHLTWMANLYFFVQNQRSITPLSPLNPFPQSHLLHQVLKN